MWILGRVGSGGIRKPPLTSLGQRGQGHRDTSQDWVRKPNATSQISEFKLTFSRVGPGAECHSMNRAGHTVPDFL